MLNESGKNLDQPTPRGMFSLIFPGSQGAHAGDTGILKPTGLSAPNKGLTDPARFDALFPVHATDTLALSDIARVIALDVNEEPNALVFDERTAEALAKDIADLTQQTPRKTTARFFRRSHEQRAGTILLALLENLACWLPLLPTVHEPQMATDPIRFFRVQKSA